MTKVANSGHDENGLWIGGIAGDQDGTEWYVGNWWCFGQNVVLRHPNKKVRELMAEMAVLAANNNLIGYDQGQRTTFWTQLQRANYDPSKIKVACEADCSAGVCSIIKAVGYRLGIQALMDVPVTSTHYMRYYLQRAGFTVHTDYKYTRSPDYLLPGDVNLAEQSHTNMVVTKGSKAVDVVDIPKQPDSKPINNAGLYYRAHVQTAGWLASVHDGMIAGTVGDAKRMEAFKVTPPVGVELDVMVHLQGVGDVWYRGIKKGQSSGTGSSPNDPIIGTVGEARRIEGVLIHATENSTGKKLKYRLHLQGIGWTDWSFDGQYCGTRGQKRRVEAIQMAME